jgi:hypothetical protein
VKHQDWFEKEVYLQEHALLTSFHQEFRSFVSSTENEQLRSTLAYRRLDGKKPLTKGDELQSHMNKRRESDPGKAMGQQRRLRQHI